MVQDRAEKIVISQHYQQSQVLNGLSGGRVIQFQKPKNELLELSKRNAQISV